jgi:hypothetical protein
MILKVTKIDKHLYVDILDMKVKQSSVLTYHPYIYFNISFFLLFHLILFPLYNDMLSYLSRQISAPSYTIRYQFRDVIYPVLKGSI